MRGLTMVIATSDPVRFHAGLSIAAASAATGAAARVYLHDGAVVLLAPPLTSPDDADHIAAGLPTLAQMIEEALAVGVSVLACQSGLALAGLAVDALDPRVEMSGLVSLMGSLGEDRLAVI